MDPQIVLPAVPDLDIFIIAGIDWIQNFLTTNFMFMILVTGGLKLMAKKTESVLDDKILTMIGQGWSYLLSLPSKASGTANKTEPETKA